MITPARPVLRYPGGKWKCAEWIISHFPRHEVYCEVFGGGASVLMRKTPSRTEIYNDINGRVVNVFRVLRDEEKSKRLFRALELTPYAFDEYKACFGFPADDVDDARMLICRSYMGFGSDSVFRNNGFKHGFKNHKLDSNNTFQSYLKNIPLFINRLKNVVIENMDCFTLISKYDSEKTLFYVDPPYLKKTLTKYAPEYPHEFETDEQHSSLAEMLNGCQGNVILSGYSSDLYSKLYKDWAISTKKVVTGIGSTRSEMLWIKRQENSLFS